MTAYELAIACTEDRPAFEAEMRRRTLDIHRRIAASAARIEGLSAEQEQAYFEAIKDTPATLPGGKAVPIHEIGMRAAKENIK